MPPANSAFTLELADYVPVPPEDSDDYGIAIIGCGQVVREAHAPAYQKARYRVAARFDIERAQAEKVAGMLPGCRVAASLTELLETPDIRIIDLALHPHHRIAALEQIASLPPAQRPRAVLSQKPFALSEADAGRMMALCRDAGIALSVNQQMRYAPAPAAIRRLIARGDLGRVYSVTHLKCGNQDQAGKWWAQMEDFLLRDYAVHFLDLTRCFTGREPLRVKAVTGRKPGQVAVAPLLYSIALEYGPDAETVSTLHFNDLIPTNPATAHEEWWVDGTDESVLATHSQLTFVSRAAPQHQHVVSLQGGWYPDAFIGSIGEVMRSLSENRASEISADDNLYTLRLSQAALESSQTGEAVALPTRAER